MISFATMSTSTLMETMWLRGQCTMSRAPS